MAVDLDAVRAHCTSLPEVEEVLTWEDHPTFRVRNKIFVICAADGSSYTVRTSKEEQAELLAAEPATFTRAPYVGQHGWTAVAGATADPDEVRDLLTEAWRRTAPKRLAATVPSPLERP